MNKEEYQRKIAEIRANHTPAQAKAYRLIKPVFFIIAVIFIILLIALIVDSSNDQKPVETPTTKQPSQDKDAFNKLEAAKWEKVSNLTDCLLAYKIYSAYSPIMAELMDFAETKSYFVKQEAVNWKESTKLDQRLDALNNIYPSTYTVDYPNAIIAHGMNFAIGQYWRDVFFHVTNAREDKPAVSEDKPAVSEQTQLMQDDLNVLKSQCPNEFEGLSNL
jgi:hypothetical protein